MAMYHGMYEEGLRHLDTCTVDIIHKEIRVTKPVTFLQLHRDLQDAFDDYDLITETTPTSRFTDTIEEKLPPWTFIDINKVKGTLKDWRTS